MVWTRWAQSMDRCRWVLVRRVGTRIRREVARYVGKDNTDFPSSSDLMATFYTKRTPIVKAHHTPRNLCMVAGSFVAPSRPSQN